MTAARLIWEAAGRPEPDHYRRGLHGRCWWCCEDIVGGRAVADMPDSFLDALGTGAGCPSATHLCEPCAWTLSDAVRLPYGVGRGLLGKALAGDGDHPGRVLVAVGPEAPARRLVLLLASGRIGVWERPGRADEEARWVEARPALRNIPCTVGSATYLGVYDYHHLVARVGGKFRNFIPFATASGRWEMWTKADRTRIRDVLLVPPPEPWTLAIGDGQKHVAIYGVVSDGRQSVQATCLEGANIVYRPPDLRALLEAFEDLIRVGFSRDQIETGRFGDRDHVLLARQVLAQHGVLVARMRGSGVFALALWLLGSAAELRSAP